MVNSHYRPVAAIWNASIESDPIDPNFINNYWHTAGTAKLANKGNPGADHNIL